MTTLEMVQVDYVVMEWILKQAGPEHWQEKFNSMLRRAMEEERASENRKQQA